MLRETLSTLRPAWLEVDESAISANIAAVRARVGHGVGVMAVVKANGYGHGMVPAATAALRGGAAWLGVAIPEEALVLREAGITAPILVMGCSPPDAVDLLVRHGITATVSTARMLAALHARARSLDAVARVHLKVDTGMGRVGVPPQEIGVLMGLALEAAPHVQVTGLMTHLATADEDDASLAHTQLERFRQAYDSVRDCLAEPFYIHAANSAAVCRLPEAYRPDGWPGARPLVRPGLLTYGIPPVPEGALPGIRPALSLKARVAQARDVPIGTTVSYGATFRTSRPTRLALIPLGYADGYSRSLGNRGFVLLRGAFAPVIGRVCMDQFVVDATDCGADAGDEVVLIGEQGSNRITVLDVAEWAGTIHHEVLARLGERLPRVYPSPSA